MERMVGASLYGGGKGDPGCFLQGEGTISREAMGNLFGSSSSVSAGFHGSKSMMYFEDFNAATVVRPIRRRFEMEETGEDDLDEFGLNQPEKKRRLTMDQVQFLERSFELENKLEPERKMQLARDLGLQPRQVAIWFQNRRARWKTKQIEKDHEALQSSFDTLKKDHDELLKENEKLQIEVNDLKEKLLKEEKAGSNSTTTNFSSRDLLLQTSSCSSQPLPPPPPFILEDLCSVNSTDLDCENSHNYVEDVWHSDLSAPEEDDEEKRLEIIGNYGGFEETALWFWQH